MKQDEYESLKLGGRGLLGFASIVLSPLYFLFGLAILALQWGWWLAPLYVFYWWLRH